MEKVKKILILLIIIVVIILIVISILKIQSDKVETDQDDSYSNETEVIEKIEEIHIEENRNRFYVVKNCIEQFYQNYEKLNVNNLDIKLADEEINFNGIKKEYEENIYAMLDKEYISYKNITLDNISEKLGNIGITEVYVDRIYTKELENSSYICFAEGRTKENNQGIKDFKMIVRLSGTNTFKIFLEDYLIEKNYNDFSKDMDVTELCASEITNDEHNVFETQIIDSRQYINDIFDYYKTAVRKDPDYAYELVDPEYKNIRFGSKEEYLTYRKDNYTKLVSTTLKSYNEKQVNEIKQYLCQDNYGNYYIFKETAPFQYKVVLDNYTIPTEDFKETYSSSSDAEKVILNIKRFFMGIDDKNYGYSYSVLSEEFRNNKYPTKNDFINYVKENFFEENDIDYIKYEKQNGLYIYNIGLTDATGVNTETKTFNMIIKLKNGTDFEMSFGKN